MDVAVASSVNFIGRRARATTCNTVRARSTLLFVTAKITPNSYLRNRFVFVNRSSHPGERLSRELAHPFLLHCPVDGRASDAEQVGELSGAVLPRTTQSHQVRFPV